MTDFSIRRERFDSAGNRILGDVELYSAGPITLAEPKLETVYTDEVKSQLDAWAAENGFEPTFKVIDQEYDDQGDRIVRTVKQVEIVQWTSSPELWEAFLAGFEASGEGHNDEYRHPAKGPLERDPDVNRAFNQFLLKRERTTR